MHIHPAQQPYRVAGDEAADVWIIVAVAVVVQPRFVVVVLALEAQGVAQAGALGGLGDEFAGGAPGLVFHFQRPFAFFIGQELGGAQVVGVVVEHRTRGGRGRWGLARGVLGGVVGGVGAPGRDADALDGVGVHLGQGHKAARFKQVMDGAAVPGLKGQGVAIPAIKGVAGGADLGDAAAQGVVVIVTPGTSHKII